MNLLFCTFVTISKRLKDGISIENELVRSFFILRYVLIFCLACYIIFYCLGQGYMPIHHFYFDIFICGIISEVNSDIKWS